MAFQSLYRRFRPQRFSEVKGQAHLVSALRNAVRDERVGHAYLLSGPRGTGKTSTARLLAKALNCENLGDDGEPCTTCDSCVSIENGSSMDLFELDAASNRGIDDVKDLVRSVAMGTPGRRKVYILDEVHMLTKEASSALLKTLEEPPDHVVFVLATTDPQKVLPTIRSRTQHVELALVGAETMAQHVREVAAAADLDVADEVVEHVVRRGGGSVRDTLSMLDQVVAAGGIGDEHLSVDAIVRSLADRDPGAALAAVAAATSAGADPRDLTEQLTRQLRDIFLVQQDAAPVELPADHVATLTEQGSALGSAAAVRALETLGTSLVDMRQASDTRLVLEVALVRLTSHAASPDVEALLRRVEALEVALESGGTPAKARSSKAEPATRPTVPHPAAAGPPTSTGPAGDSGPAPTVGNAAPSGKAAAARDALAAVVDQPDSVTAEPVAPNPPPPAPQTSRDSVSSPSPPSDAVSSPSDLASTAPADGSPRSDSASLPSPPSDAVSSPSDLDSTAPADGSPAGNSPTSADIIAAWSEVIQPSLSTRARARFQVGHFEDGPDGVVNYVLPTSHYLDRCIEVRDEVVGSISQHFGAGVALEVVLDSGESTQPQAAATSSASSGAPDEVSDDYIASVDTENLTDASDSVSSGAERLRAAFPGASIVDPEAP